MWPLPPLLSPPVERRAETQAANAPLKGREGGGGRFSPHGEGRLLCPLPLATPTPQMGHPVSRRSLDLRHWGKYSQRLLRDVLSECLQGWGSLPLLCGPESVGLSFRVVFLGPLPRGATPFQKHRARQSGCQVGPPAGLVQEAG